MQETYRCSSGRWKTRMPTPRSRCCVRLIIVVISAVDVLFDHLPHDVSVLWRSILLCEPLPPHSSRRHATHLASCRRCTPLCDECSHPQRLGCFPSSHTAARKSEPQIGSRTHPMFVTAEGTRLVDNQIRNHTARNTQRANIIPKE